MHVVSIDRPIRDRRRIYQVFPSRNTFHCRGRCICGMLQCMNDGVESPRGKLHNRDGGGSIVVLGTCLYVLV